MQRLIGQRISYQSTDQGTQEYLFRRSEAQAAYQDFIWLTDAQINTMTQRPELMTLEHRTFGRLIAEPILLRLSPTSTITPPPVDWPEQIKTAQKDAQLTLLLGNGEALTLNLVDILEIHFPNQLSWVEKMQVFGKGLLQFMVESPRQGGTEGGIFPALFGTVITVLIMTVFVTPIGVMAAVYLHEYARLGWITQTIRIAVYNLAGTPSIVFGVFGLAFFVYTLGGSIDQLFYSESLPMPTFGTPGLIWVSLTLALLTLPVVIVSTEEGLARIPKSVREGSLALGASHTETLWRIVLPLTTPAILTGLILAIARAAGEVAPLMLVGVVKLAPELPLDAEFPFLHLDRKIMHLGYHIFDLAFQTGRTDASLPFVFTTALLLILLIILLNLSAILLRNRLRVRFQDDKKPI
ncbi:Phosphate transport system permease protein pstA [Nitrincola nitratireducens]|uniref:Phosphate transport system permease protein PstA n=1 Tax=Nitrincola nitratireducens TaxID=1229521 RepID=W9UY88_9GAMM|nr:Phosphate transport system permease protein pstA [Nitrincola nitratireducens]